MRILRSHVFQPLLHGTLRLPAPRLPAKIRFRCRAVPAGQPCGLNFSLGFTVCKGNGRSQSYDFFSDDNALDQRTGKGLSPPGTSRTGVFRDVGSARGGLFRAARLFSQWGAKFAPKVIVKRSGQTECEKYSGWHTASDCTEYRVFLEALLTALGRFLREKGLFERSYFHISDEPDPDSLERYRSAAELFHRALPGGKFLNALSHAEFFREGAVQIPVASINRFEEFTGLDLPERWTYYCVSQWEKVTNQFMHFPSARNRIFGVLAYIYRLDGFLHWGYNFWSGQLSTFRVDPYRDPCAGRGFPPGDAFKVYPGPNGEPEDSIRHEVFFDALQDLAALRKLEEKSSRKTVLNLIRRIFGKLPAMSDYPREATALLDLRRAVNAFLDTEI